MGNSNNSCINSCMVCFEMDLGGTLKNLRKEDKLYSDNQKHNY